MNAELRAAVSRRALRLSTEDCAVLIKGAQRELLRVASGADIEPVEMRLLAQACQSLLKATDQTRTAEDDEADLGAASAEFLAVVRQS